MSLLKAELKQLVTTEVGIRVEDALEAAKHGLAVYEGRQIAMMDASKAVDALAGVVDSDITADKFDLETGAHIKRYLTRASSALQNLSQQAANLRIAQAGKIQGFEHTVTLLKNMIDAEKETVANLKAAEAAPPPENPASRTVGTHPLSIKELRLAEEAAETVAATPAAIPEPPLPLAPPPTEPVTTTVTAPVAEPPVAPPEPPVAALETVKRRGRRSRAIDS